MKIWIKKQLRESLNEMKPIPKPEFGSGIQHTVFKSKQDPNRLYKIGKKSTVEAWVKIFNENPEIFPKIYRVFPSKKNQYYWIVEIEKLNTELAKKDFSLAAKNLSEFTRQKYDAGIWLARIDNLDDYIQNFNEFMYDFEHYLREIYKDESTIRKCLEWVETVYKIYKNLETRYDYYDKDIHSDNVAYDNNGNIKIIDI